jgi:hypothetical protein
MQGKLTAMLVAGALSEVQQIKYKSNKGVAVRPNASFHTHNEEY